MSPCKRWRHMGGVDLQLHLFLTSALDKGKWSGARPGRFTSGVITPGTNWVAGWLGPTPGLDASNRVKFSFSYHKSKHFLLIFQLVTLPTTLLVLFYQVVRRYVPKGTTVHSHRSETFQITRTKVLLADTKLRDVLTACDVQSWSCAATGQQYRAGLALQLDKTTELVLRCNWTTAAILCCLINRFSSYIITLRSGNVPVLAHCS